jgi:hypothetical protein
MTRIIIAGLVCLIAGLVFIFAQPGPTLPPARRSVRKQRINLLEDIGAGAVRKDRGGNP